MRKYKLMLTLERQPLTNPMIYIPAGLLAPSPRRILKNPSRRIQHSQTWIGG